MKLKVVSHGETRELPLYPGSKLLDVLQSSGIPVNAACGGKGSCHKCRIRVQSGFLAVGFVDRKAFTEEEQKEGWRLSCQATCRTSIEIVLPQIESLRSKPRVVHRQPVSNLKRPVLACDLGSTGVVLAIGDAATGNTAIEIHALNRQIRFGADVMTRLDSAQRKGVLPLQDALKETLRTVLKMLEAELPADLYAALIQKGITFAGNSVMTSFLHGWSIEILAVSPFQPIKLDPDSTEWEGVRWHSLPLLAGFVGGDAYACAVAIESDSKNRAPWMMVDIGTNTEIIVKTSKDQYWYSSAPAGPAFEGGNITFGMRAEPGAIAHAKWTGSEFKIEVLGNDRPVGICGSGLVDLLFESIKGGLIHLDGLVPEARVNVTKEIKILADDVREFQLAKSATRTAADLLIERAGERPQTLYLAGTFAEHLREDSVFGVGLLPENVPIVKIGNASLKGALLYAGWSDGERAAFRSRFEKNGHPIELALQDDFQDKFVKNLDFPPLPA